jgi:hypothetical protein
MKEIASGQRRGWWWRVTRRTHGVLLGVSVHWPSKNWDQWQVGILVIDLAFGRQSLDKDLSDGGE